MSWHRFAFEQSRRGREPIASEKRKLRRSRRKAEEARKARDEYWRTVYAERRALRTQEGE